MEHDKAAELLQRYLDGQCDAEESALVERAYGKAIAPHPAYYDELTITDITSRAWSRTRARTAGRLYRYRWPVAAAALLALAALGWWVAGRTGKTSTYALLRDVAPGSAKATLVLDDGTPLDLGKTAKGLVAIQGDQAVSKAADGELAYAREGGAGSRGGYNAIYTPRGGAYNVVLPDGSKVWLNAASSLRFPVSLGATGQRVVQLTGEAYFEVNADARRPFIVETPAQQVRALGTQFNVCAYTDDPSETTTLLEGAVNVHSLGGGGDHPLRPGQQAAVEDGQVRIGPAVADAIAWQQGKMRFHDTPLPDLMRQVSRWYDIDVVYQGAIPQKRFSGGIRRDTHLSTLLKILELSSVRFSMREEAGRRMLVVQPDDGN
ncbi:FecR family protein [Chitinophaga lutea]